jgi:chemotaxis protein CheX
VTQLNLKRCTEVLCESIAEIAETMLFAQVAPGEVAEERVNTEPDYSAAISYSGGIEGGLHLSGSKAAVLKLAAALLGEAREEMDADMCDALGEMANMVAGGVQGRLEGELGTISLSPPEVFAPQSEGRAMDASLACLGHQFALEGETFLVEIFFGTNQDI